MGLTTYGASALSAGINFLGNLFGSGMSADYNAEEAQKNREWQEKMYHQQVEDNIKFWNMQNEYNLPSAVYQRQLEGMKQNGLNPLLMYGESGVSPIGTAQQAPESGKPGSGAQAQTHFNTQIDLANLKLVEAQAKLLESQANKTDKESENIGEQTTGLKFNNWLNNQTSNVLVAIRYRDYDRVNQLIDESRQRTFNMHEENARAWSQLTYQTNLAIRAQNLNEWQVGRNIDIAMQQVANDQIRANAALKSASAAWLDAKTRYNLSFAQIGLLREQASNMRWQNKWLEETFGSRKVAQQFITQQEFWKKQNLMMENLFKEAGIMNIDSQNWLRRYQADLMQSQSMFYNMQTFMAPVNALSGFGTPFQNAGNSFNGYQYTVTP